MRKSMERREREVSSVGVLADSMPLFIFFHFLSPDLSPVFGT